MTPAPKRHRAALHRAPRRHRRLFSRRTVTAAAIGGVLLTSGAAVSQAGPAVDGQPVLTMPVATDGADVSRDAERPPLAAVEAALTAAAEEAEKSAAEAKKAEDARLALEETRKNPQEVARTMLADYGWDAAQFSCLDSLWIGESDWDYQATNPSSGAYGIPQSLPATKMATAGKDWKTNPTTQIRWGLDYIRASYGTPCAANSFKSNNNWY